MAEGKFEHSKEDNLCKLTIGENQEKVPIDLIFSNEQGKENRGKIINTKHLTNVIRISHSGDATVSLTLLLLSKIIMFRESKVMPTGRNESKVMTVKRIFIISFHKHFHKAYF